MEKLEYFIVRPSVKTFGGIRINKDTEFEVYNDDQTVHQTMKDLVLTTEITRETEYNGIKSKEESKLTSELPENTVIVWGEDTGYIVPNFQMVRPEEAVEELSKVVEITKPIEEGTSKAITKEV